MENEKENNSKQSCCSNDNCCTTHKKTPLWKKCVFIAIIIAAMTIIRAKFVDNKECDHTGGKCCKTEETTCCPHSK